MRRTTFKVGDRVHHELDRLHYGTVVSIDALGFCMVAWDSTEDAAAHNQLFADFNLRKYTGDEWADDFDLSH